MGLFSFGEKYQLVWNALMASNTFFGLDAARQHMVLGAVRDQLEEQLATTPEKIKADYGPIVLMNFFVYAMGDLKISPALGGKWFWIKNPFVAFVGAAELLAGEKAKLEAKHGVKFVME